MTMYSYQPEGVCAKYINIELDGDTIKTVEFLGGCPGNGKAVAKLVEGRNVDEITELLAGNCCGNKPTSCADQMVKGFAAIREYEKEQAAAETQE